MLSSWPPTSEHRCTHQTLKICLPWFDKQNFAPLDVVFKKYIIYTLIAVFQHINCLAFQTNPSICTVTAKIPNNCSLKSSKLRLSTPALHTVDTSMLYIFISSSSVVAHKLEQILGLSKHPRQIRVYSQAWTVVPQRSVASATHYILPSIQNKAMEFQEQGTTGDHNSQITTT